MSLIELTDVRFFYSETLPPVLRIDELRIEKGERVFIYGPSGSGKTTLLEILAGVLTVSSGKVQILNANMKNLSNTERDQFRASHMGYVFQIFNLIPYLNVQENIELPYFLSRIKKDKCKNLNAEIQHLTQSLGISDLLSRPVSELSIGQQQRVAVARALLGSPEIILADEPTSSLDYDHREKFIKILFQVCEQAQSTVVFVSHDRTLEKLFHRTINFAEINRARPT